MFILSLEIDMFLSHVYPIDIMFILSLEIDMFLSHVYPIDTCPFISADLRCSLLSPQWLFI